MGRRRRSLPELPHEIIFREILPRLPAKSLLRFKLVCRKWRDLISDPNFIHTHLHHLNQVPSSTQQLNVLFTSQGKLYSRIIKSNFLSSIQVARNPLPPTKWFKPFINWGARLVGSCNGLICLESKFQNLGLWNPCTGSYRSLGGRIPCFSSLGFGYDAYTRDFKLIEINAIKKWHFKVFSLNSNSWRTISDMPKYSLKSIEPGKFIDGVLYWVNFGNFDRVVCFDIHDEVFSELSLPDVCPEDKCKIEISDIGGCLALARVLNRIRFEVWLMKDNWIKMYSVDVSSCGHRIDNLIPLGGIRFIRRNNEEKDTHVDRVIYVSNLSLQYLNLRSFFSFNPSDSQFSSFPFPDSSYLAECGSIITYVESLASVNPDEKRTFSN